MGLGAGTEEEGDILKMVCFLLRVTARDKRRGGEKAGLGGNNSLRVCRTSEKQGLPVGEGHPGECTERDYKRLSWRKGTAERL